MSIITKLWQNTFQCQYSTTEKICSKRKHSEPHMSAHYWQLYIFDSLLLFLINSIRTNRLLGSVICWSFRFLAVSVCGLPLFSHLVLVSLSCRGWVTRVLSPHPSTLFSGCGSASYTCVFYVIFRCGSGTLVTSWFYSCCLLVFYHIIINRGASDRYFTITIEFLTLDGLVMPYAHSGSTRP